MTPSPYQYVTFTADTGLAVKVLMDETAASLTGGFGGWEVVARPKRVAITRYSGKSPFKMDVPILFDGWADNKSQERAISTLIRMAEQPGELQQPPVLRVSGSLPRRDLPWVIEDITWDSSAVMWTSQSGVPVRLRQGAVVHLLQFVDDNIITTAPTPAVKAGGGKSGNKTKTGSGKTVKQEAQAEYGSANLWQYLLDANPWMSADPRQVIPTGKTFIVPRVAGITVPQQPNPFATHAPKFP